MGYCHCQGQAARLGGWARWGGLGTMSTTGAVGQAARGRGGRGGYHTWAVGRAAWAQLGSGLGVHTSRCCCLHGACQGCWAAVNKGCTWGQGPGSLGRSAVAARGLLGRGGAAATAVGWAAARGQGQGQRGRRRSSVQGRCGPVLTTPATHRGSPAAKGGQRLGWARRGGLARPARLPGGRAAGLPPRARAGARARGPPSLPARVTRCMARARAGWAARGGCGAVVTGGSCSLARPTPPGLARRLPGCGHILQRPRPGPGRGGRRPRGGAGSRPWGQGWGCPRLLGPGPRGHGLCGWPRPLPQAAAGRGHKARGCCPRSLPAAVAARVGGLASQLGRAARARGRWPGWAVCYMPY